MQLVRSTTEVRATVRAARATGGDVVGLVPTMGYLHEGHLSLMRAARRECRFVVVSIFVNPTQFGPGEDLERYPRDLERDMALCEQVPVDLIFHPSAAEIYPQPYLTSVQVSEITERLCGASRPGHFQGVATVVSKLLNIVKPDIAYFGQKDAQQVVVIRQMVRDLNLDVEIRSVPIVREPDGLAMSSRNVYLSPEERRAALGLSRALHMAQGRVASGERDLAGLCAAVRAVIAAEPLAQIDYVEIVDPTSLLPMERLAPGGEALAAVAVKFGKTRLIDNLLLRG